MASTTTKPLDLDHSLEDLLKHLPKENFWQLFDLHQWEGVWLGANEVKAALTMRLDFQARNDDVILASCMKTGTTWLKALLTCIMLSDKDDEDPLTKNQPAAYVQTLEVQVYGLKPVLDPLTMESPRVFHTHLPYSVLPDSIKNSDCKIIYITRNPKDTLVSMWHFAKPFQSPENHAQISFSFDQAFEVFCKGICPHGPFFEHILQYWNESLKMPKKILFLKYEDLKKDPKGEVIKLASFLGSPFGTEEEVDNVVRRCSLERLKNLEVNQDGADPWVGIPKSAFFRKGIVGDWKNHFTPEMADRLDEITRIKLEGSGLNIQA